MSGRLLSDGLYQQIGQTVRRVRRLDRTLSEANTSNARGASSSFPIRAVILDEALTGGSFLAPSSGLATVCRWSVEDGEYTQTELQITVYNHSSEEPEADTPGAAILIDGHHWFFADCEPLASRPTPPWDEEE